jgi:hypothetical protein
MNENAPEEARTLDLDYGAVYSNQLSYRSVLHPIF